MTLGEGRMLDAERRRLESAATGADLRIPAEDGRLLAATLFAPPGGAHPASPLTIIAGGTGIPRHYYARFAAWLACPMASQA